MSDKKVFKSDISGIEYFESDKISADSIRTPLLDLIRKDHPHFSAKQCISNEELNIYREKYIAKFLSADDDELSDLEKHVVKSIKDDDKSFVNQVEEEVDNRNFGQRVADKVADFGGSWTFIISFFIFILIWIGSNVYILLNKGFDPYPFILLNLILSCLAALQAPVIMMSQNRQEEKDRERAKKDYMINLKSE